MPSTVSSIGRSYANANRFGIVSAMPIAGCREAKSSIRPDSAAAKATTATASTASEISIIQKNADGLSHSCAFNATSVTAASVGIAM